MPNGESRNWIRLLMTLGSFYAQHGSWPTTVQVYDFFIEELKRKLTEDDYATLQAKISLVVDNEHPFVAIDGDGNRYDYSRQGMHRNLDSAPDAREWLGIPEPDYDD